MLFHPPNPNSATSRYWRGLEKGFSREPNAETEKTKTKTMAADSKPDRARLRCHHCAGPLSMETVSAIPFTYLYTMIILLL